MRNINTFAYSNGLTWARRQAIVFLISKFVFELKLKQWKQ